LIRCTSSNQETAKEQIQELNQYLKEGREYVLKNFSGYEHYNRYQKRLELNGVIEGNLDLAEAGTTRVRKKSK